jgi:hypothetical protein
MAQLGEVRRSQVVSTYGPGALVPVEEASYMVVGLDSWQADDMSLDIKEPRLERLLGVSGFKLPPSSDGDDRNARDLPVVRFPRMYSCSNCHVLGRYRDIAGIDRHCAICGHRLVTSRFIVVCEAGHTADFPYHRWVHKDNPQPEGAGHRLTLRAEGRSAALSDIYVECSCGDRRSLGGALSKSALRGVTSCRGDQPWLRGSDPVNCDMQPRGVQRGASNVWQPVTESAISIPPWSREAGRFVDRYWTAIKHIPDAALEAALMAMLQENGPSIPMIEVLAVIAEQRQLAANEPPTPASLREQEHEALMRGASDDGRQQDFVCLPISTDEAVPWPMSNVRLVTRLREVRALTGFYRLVAPAPGSPLSPLSREVLRWLPAIEVSGEGVFMGLDLESVRAWELLPEVRARVARLGGAHDSQGLPLAPDRVPTPRRVLLHTLAHVLIDQWSLDCGYPAASLRERLYIGDDMAGLLIYTATSDSAGSLGGVVGMAKDGRFHASVLEALHRSAWCSNDPLCMESGPTGVEARNLGACHSCCLLPETSCELSNSLLDRGLLIGSPDGCPGFFASSLAD